MQRAGWDAGQIEAMCARWEAGWSFREIGRVVGKSKSQTARKIQSYIFAGILKPRPRRLVEKDDERAG